MLSLQVEKLKTSPPDFPHFAKKQKRGNGGGEALLLEPKLHGLVQLLQKLSLGWLKYHMMKPIPEVVAENPISQAKEESAILQGHCGSCWAFGAAELLSDRFCIHYGLHARAIYVGMVVNCDGRYPLEAWRYFVRKGVITEECDPYFDNKGYPTPQCKRKCVKENLLWSKSKHFGVNAYLINSDPYSIICEDNNNA
ncbi:hypothetical protein KY290_014021 [Solanum tuberosum]|uniref:Peptidase C1A papain C-terminal domain-containing protein n=1 Tax=Solanum tuberosum TaxID=4113 RepID=A0ABQ7VQH8_SOLTU|nr:hypothetical protein KY289_014122 [Solanum tuberosum]KAH0699205.1 hypothetical protein KY284_013420 [Solanum tuberosum]KAH0770040.1 hypothetical protein KY290_014021 [Solanum tuberosum]